MAMTFANDVGARCCARMPRPRVRGARDSVWIDQEICGGPRGCAATIGAAGEGVAVAAGSDSREDATCRKPGGEGGGPAALTAPPAQHGACAQWCSLDAGGGMMPPAAKAAAVRVTEQKSPGDGAIDAFA